MANWPRKRILLSSHGADLVQGSSRAIRRVFQEHGDGLGGYRISEESHAADWWEIQGHHGCFWAKPFGGSIIGKRANFIIGDDLVKNEEVTRSKLQRDHMWESYTMTWRTRLEADGCEIMITTRWHEDDIAGRVERLAEDGVEEWTILRFPALAEEEDPLYRDVGEPLWPERGYTREKLEGIRRVMLPSQWNAAYQQRPTAVEGSLFREEDFRYFGEDLRSYVLYPNKKDGNVEPRVYDKDACWTFLTADLASSTREFADYTVMCVWAVTPDSDLLLLDAHRDRLEGPDQLELLHRLNVENPSMTSNSIEAQQYQATLAQWGRRGGLLTEEVHVHKDKMVRAQGPALRMRNGTLFFRRNAEWLPPLQSELLNFRPNCEHDDFVDNLSIASEKLASNVVHATVAGVVSTMRRKKVKAVVDPRYE